MLEDLITKESPKQKKKKLNETYGIVMTQELEGRIDDMCNFSTIFWERGIHQGDMKRLVSQVCKKIVKGKALEAIADDLEEEPEAIRHIYEVALEHAPEYDVDEIVEELLAAV